MLVRLNADYLRLDNITFPFLYNKKLDIERYFKVRDPCLNEIDFKQHDCTITLVSVEVKV